MCGICGFAGFEDKGLLRRMAKSIEHRGPDDEGFFTDKSVSLGNRRLKIIDLKGGHQPICNEDGSMVIVFNGEIYNYKELRNGLEKKGHRFSTNSDTEVIVHLYEELGPGCPERLRGMFTFAIWDSGKRSLFLARDRIGIKPLYYHLSDGKLVFASEIKALLQSGEIDKKIKNQALFSFLVFQYTLGENTIIENIKRLMPGHTLEYQNGKTKIRRYWDTRMEPVGGNYEDLTRRFRNLLEESVKMRLMSEVPFGAYLSGGIDSSSVVAMMSKHVNEPVKTFSVGFGERDDELGFARTVSDFLGTEHREFYFDSSDLVKSFQRFIWHLDEPLADGGAIPTFLLSQKVKKHATVIMVGEGADENLAGYSWHRIISGWPKRPFTESMRLKLYYKMNTLAKENYLTGYSGYKIFLPFYRKDTPSPLNRILEFEIRNLLPNSLLMKVDRMTMSSSIEARVPYLDHKMVEFCGALPIDLKLRKNEGKYIQKKAMKGILPDKIIKRRKHGFLVPLNKWISGELGEVAKQTLSDSSFSIEVFDKNSTKNLFRASGIDKIRKTNMIWRLLLYQKWHEEFISG